jgi:hypothetical protein
LLAGKPPFHEIESIFGKMKAHLELPVPPIRVLRPEVPLGLSDLLARIMEKSPGDRLHDAEEIAEQLRSYTKGSSLADLYAGAARDAKEPATTVVEPTPDVPHRKPDLRQFATFWVPPDSDYHVRQRLKQSAVIVASTAALLFLWDFISDNPATLTADGSYFSLRVGLEALESLLAVVVVGLLASRAEFNRDKLRIVEYVLFLGVAALLIASQYFVVLDLMRRGDPALYAPIILSFIKNGVLQILGLMFVYIIFTPNPPWIAARTLVVIYGGSVLAMYLVRLHPEAAPTIAVLRTAEDSGSNFLLLSIGSVLAILGTFMVKTSSREPRP